MKQAISIAAWLALAAATAQARETIPGQYDSIPDSVRQWFKAQKSPVTGVPCCDVADGYKTEADIRDGHWWVPSREDPAVWVSVPDDVIIYNQGNPNGNHVVWWGYGAEDGHAPVRCFVPGGGV